MIDWPKDIIEDIAKRNSVLYLGSGVSHNSINDNGEHPKTWKAFLEDALNNSKIAPYDKACIKAKLEKEDYLLACELLKLDLGREVFNNLLIDTFLKPRFHPADIHKHIFNLDVKIVVTPNFDKIYETYASSETCGETRVKNFYDKDLADFIRKPSRLVLKLHGSIDSPDKMIFTQREYARARSENSDFYQLLNSLIMTNTFIFLGAGLNDPDIKLLLENYAFQFAYSRKHYFIIPNKQLSENEQSIYSDTLNVNFITYDPADNHKDLTDSLGDLVLKVEAKREEISKTQSW